MTKISTKKKKYRFTYILDEIRTSDDRSYKTNLLEFINCLILYSDQPEQRVRIRNELYGLRLGEVLSSLRSQQDRHLEVQLQVFDESLTSDEVTLPATRGLDLGSTLDVFHAVHRQVLESQQELPFLTVLQHLLKIDASNERLSETIWNTVEKLVAQATGVESEKDAQKLVTSVLRRSEGRDRSTSGSRTRRESTPASDNESRSLQKVDESSEVTSSPPPAPPAPPIGMMPGAPPPPPPPPMGGGPPPPPPPPFGQATGQDPLPNIPKPRAKMRTLNWQKIPITNVIGKPNLWTQVGKLSKDYNMDYQKMDELFSVNPESSPKRLGQSSDGQPDNKKKRESSEINIIDGKRSMNVNIVLKQFRMSHEEIVQLIRDGQSDKFGAEKLRSLLNMLPSQEEIDAINSFDGDRSKLGNAEKFFITLMGLPNYRMRIEGLLIKEEFNTHMEWIRPAIEAIIQAAGDIQDNESLKELIFLILISGNYLNSGNYAGNAAGFRLSSLLKLTELRANKPGVNLMHYVAQEAAEKNPKLLRFPSEMKFLKDASQVSVESLVTDVSNIANKVRAITEQICLAGKDFQQQMSSFLKEANVEVNELEEDLKEIEHIRTEMATYFCEDLKTFKIEECCAILQTFCDKLKKAYEENVQRQLMEVKAEQRRSMSGDPRRNSGAAEADHQLIRSPTGEKGANIFDQLLADVRNGYAASNFSDGNFSITKRTKVSLAPQDALNIINDADMNGDPGSSFVRAGHGRVSQRRRRGDGSAHSPNGPSPTPDSARTSVSLDEILLESDASIDNKPKPETTFERYASLRRRRMERKAKRPSTLDILGADRERATSPSPLSATSTPGSDNVTMRLGSTSTGRPKSEHVTPEPKHQPMQRSRSFAEQKRKDEDTDDLINRLKQKLAKKDGRLTPTLTEDADDAKDATPPSRNSTRWRNGIVVSETNSPLEPITEKNPTLEDFTSEAQTKAIQRTREKMSNRFKSDLNPKEVNKVLENMQNYSAEDESPKPGRSMDDSDLGSHVSTSVRLKMSQGMGTDIDQLLKTIENSGRQIDAIGVIGPMQRTTDTSSENNTPAQRNVAVVAHVTASNTPTGNIKDHEKAKREMRKKRSQLSMDDVKAAIRTLDPKSGKNVENNNNLSVNNKNTVSVSPTKTPPTPRKDGVMADKSSTELSRSDSANNKELSKAAKMTGKKKFRDARFGASNSSNNNIRPRSNVEADSVVKALKEMNKNNMSRSKSFDERVHEKEFSTVIRNSGSAPDTMLEKQAVIRNSTSRLSLDGRRNGLYIPGEGSDNEDSSSKNKSAASSTDTLLNNNEPPVEQNTQQTILNKQRLSSAPVNSVVSDTGVPPLRRSYSLLDRSKHMDEDSDDPNASIAKWRLKRERQRRSLYDNVLDGGSESTNRSSTTSSNDKDEGFESGSGTMSQRTSMSSTLESEISAQRSDSLKSKSEADQAGVNSRLVEEADRKVRTENWTEQVVLGSNVPEVKGDSKSVSPQTVAVSPAKSTEKKNSKQDAPAKPKPIPSYMMPTSRSSQRPASTTPESPFRRDTPNRTSVIERSVTPTLKRETTVRASMRAESATSGFQRGTAARTSIRGPRTSMQLSAGNSVTLSPSAASSRPRADSNTSISSRVSSVSTASAANKQKPAAKPAVPCHTTTSHNITPQQSKTRTTTTPTTPSSRSSIASNSSLRPTTPADRTKAPVTTTPSSSSPFSRSQSMRVNSRASMGPETRRVTPTSDVRRSMTPLSHEVRQSITPLPHETKRSTTPLPGDTNSRTTPVLPERPHSTIPFSQSSRTSTRRSSFMAPTAASKAKADELSAKTSTTKTPSTLTRHASLRMPKKPPTTSLTSQGPSGRKSPALSGSQLHLKQEHYQSLSVLCEAGDEEVEEEKPVVKKSPSILKRITSKVTPAKTQSKKK
ncbi:formin-J-like [Physella acuta]|uniref:formin-J-like n=1 Tax=Physella acuta TaxID=109671 RepID=UPI0027DD8C0D|nr:formin-J-like [Physella acuta]